MTRVMKTDELERPDERLRKQMRKLELSPASSYDVSVSIFCDLFNSTFRGEYLLQHSCLVFDSDLCDIMNIQWLKKKDN